MRITRLALCALLASALACTPSGRSDRDEDTDPPVTEPDAGTTQPKPDAGSTNPKPDAGSTNPKPDAGSTDPQNAAPSVSLVTPGPSADDVVVSFIVFDAESDPVDLYAEWSENGSTWHQLTAASSLLGLQSSADGLEQSLVWRSGTDVPNRVAQVRLRLTPHDAHHTGAPAQTGVFVVDNHVVQPPQNTAPQVQWRTVPALAHGSTTLAFAAIDAESDPVNAAIQWRIGSGSWQPATLASGTPVTFASSASGAVSNVIWLSDADIPSAQQNVQLRVQLDDGQLASAWATTASFQVNNQPVQPPSGSPLRFSEINASDDEDWFELVNTGSQTASVAGFKIAWEAAGQSGTIAFPTSASVPAGGRLLVTDLVRPSTGAEAGVLYLGQNIRWGSAVEGSAELLDQSGASVDFVRWEGSSQQPSQGTWSDSKILYLPADDMSLVRQGTTDHDNASDWCTAPSSRNAPNQGCAQGTASTTKMRLAEISGGVDVSGTTRPWIELVNNGTVSIDLTGWFLTTEGTAGAQYHLRRGIVGYGGGRYLVREGSGTDSANVQYIGTSTAFAFTSAGAITLRDPAGVPQDFVRFGGSQAPAPPPLAFAATPGVASLGTSFTLSRADNTLGQPSSPSYWCATNPTPGSTNAACRPAPQSGGVKISEIADGSFNFLTGETGAIELTNFSTSGATINLADYRIRWSSGGTIPAGDGFTLGNVTLAPGERAYFVECSLFGTQDPNCVGTMPWGMLSGTGPNDNGFVELLDYTGNSVDFVRWGTSVEQPTTGSWTTDSSIRLPDTKSLGRRPGFADTDRSSNWCSQERSLGSPNPSTCLP